MKSGKIMYQLRDEREIIMEKVYCKNCKYMPTVRIFGSEKCNCIIHTQIIKGFDNPHMHLPDKLVNDYAYPEIHNKYNSCKYYKESLLFKLINFLKGGKDDPQ